MNRQEKIYNATKVAWSLYGIPYKWGGDDPMYGYDCSGFVIEILQSVGILDSRGDWTAAGLYRKFFDKRIDNPQCGALAFYKHTGGTVYHVKYCVNDELTLGADGGGSTTTDLNKAASKNAFIKLRPLNQILMSRGGIEFVNPFMKDKENAE
jgi:cell wall-associated NlpC family hydrolase